MKKEVATIAIKPHMKTAIVAEAETFMQLAYQMWDRERMYGLQTILIG